MSITINTLYGGGSGVGALGGTLLWENASPSSSFAAQTVAIDLTDYDFVCIIYVANSANYATSLKSFAIVRVGGNFGTNMQLTILTSAQTNAASGVVTRNINSVTSTGIEFLGGYIKADFSSSTAATSDNTRCSPLEIYGIKGVQTS